MAVFDWSEGVSRYFSIDKMTRRPAAKPKREIRRWRALAAGDTTSLPRPELLSLWREIAGFLALITQWPSRSAHNASMRHCKKFRLKFQSTCYPPAFSKRSAGWQQCSGALLAASATRRHLPASILLLQLLLLVLNLDRNPVQFA